MAAILELDEHLNKSFKVSVPFYYLLRQRSGCHLCILQVGLSCAVDIRVFARVMRQRHVRLSDKSIHE